VAEDRILKKDKSLLQAAGMGQNTGYSLG